MEVTQLRRVMGFEEKPSNKKFLDENTELRARVDTEFGKFLPKNMNTS